MESSKELPSRSRTTRPAAKRRSTRGPLDDHGPLAAPETPERQDVAPIKTTHRLSAGSTLLSPPGRDIRRSVSPSGSASSPTRPHIDLSFLLRPALYEIVSNDTALPPFLSNSRQPEPDASLEILISTFHFRRAAEKAAGEICSGSLYAGDHQRILELFQIRLSCLILVDRTDMAAREARPLSDYASRNSRAGQRGPVGFIPWSLRLLLHRLQAGVAADGRSSIMALYAMGSECRANASATSNDAQRATWRDRLLDIGLRVAAELIEMGELDTAAEHLHTLEPVALDPEVTNRRALLHLRIGDVSTAKEILASTPDGEHAVLHGLLQLAEGNYTAAAETFAKLHAASPQDVLIANNHAVCQLYVGNMGSAASALEFLVDDHRAILAPGVLFNLATFYELATERAVDKKVRLVERVAARSPESGGWERAGAEFKL